MRTPATPWIRLIALLALLAAPTPRAAAQALAYTGGRVDVFPGGPAMIPVSPRVQDPPPTVELRLDDGRTIEGELVALDAGAPEIDPRAPRPWLPPARVWTASAPDQTTPSPAPGAARLWRVLVTPPADAAGQGLWLSGRRVPLTWRPDPWTLAPQGDPGAPWASPNPRRWIEDPTFARAAEADRSDPGRRWRWKLATGRLAPVAPADPDGPVIIESPEDLARLTATTPLADRAIEAYAVLVENLWRVALAELWRVDEDLAARVRARLAGGADLAPWPVVPAYAPLDLSAQRLLDDLADPSLSGDRRAQLARTWLADQPDALVWPIDDVGPPTTAAARPTLGVVNLTPGPEAILTAVGAGAMEAGIQRAEPRVLAIARPTVPSPAGPAPSFATARVRVAGQTASIPLAAYPVAAVPPGLLVGPLQRDWTLDEWRGGPSAPAPPSDALTSALVHRAAGLERPIREGWRVYVECLAPEFSPDDSVTLWIGPHRRPNAVVRVTAEGRATDPRRPDDAGSWVDVSKSADRWSFEIEVPPEAIDNAAVLRLGVERLDANGLHTAAPRRMLPWQTEPGRIAIDVDAWKGL